MNDSMLCILRLRLAKYLGCDYRDIDEITLQEFLAEYSKRNGNNA